MQCAERTPFLFDRSVSPHDRSHMSDVTLIRKPTIAVFVAHLAALAPLTASLGLVLVLVLGGPDQLRGSVYVLRLVSPDGDLWLGFTGACAARGESVVCRTAPATAYFTDVEASLALPLSLFNALPSDLGAPSALLLVSCASLALSLALLIWGSIDFRCATVRERALIEFRYAQLWQLEHKDGWLGELLLARRLEILGVVSALIAYVLGNVANSSTQSVGQAAVSTIAAVAGPQAYAELGGALRMLQASGYLGRW